MADSLTTQPMLEAILEGQRQFALQMTSVLDGISTVSNRHAAIEARLDAIEGRLATIESRLATIESRLDAIEGRIDALETKHDVLAAKVEELGARIDRLEVTVAALTREVRDGFDDATRKIDVLNNRLLGFEARLKRIDDRLHDEILARTR
jgi:chromosome segregation ATPase